MKKFTKKSVIQKITFAVLIIILCSVVVPNCVHADITVEPKSGGTLFNPVKNLLTAIGDAFLNLLQSTIFTEDGSKMSVAAEGIGFSVTPEENSRAEGNWWDDSMDLKEAAFYPGYLYLTPEAIFNNKISILNADFVNPITNYNDYVDGDKYESGITKLRETIAKWYVGLRNFALVGLLSVLVYVGIRIIISSAASEKAKYKQMITYWLSAIVLLFMLHYIMSFTFLITNKITEIFSGMNGNKAITTQIVGTQNGGGKKFEVEDPDKTKFSNFLDGEYSDVKGQILNGGTITGVANLTQYARLYSNITGTTGFRYLVVYIALVAYTVYFFIVYTKRVIYLAFLTLIAPLITLTYPIDKLNDGQAQAFNVWIKEFIFNVLLQPFHLLIYTIFIGMAIDFANSNLVYTVVVIAFILPAEKLLRKMFGFDKASTSNAFSGAAAGSMLATAISKAGSKASGSGSKGGSGDKGGSGSSGESTSNRTGTETNPYAAYEGDDNGNNNDVNNNNNNNQNNTNNENQNNQNNRNDDIPILDEERRRTQSEREALDGFLEEGTDPNSDWSDDDYRAYEELDREQEAREENLRLAEQQEAEQEQQQQQEAEQEQQQQQEAEQEIEQPQQPQENNELSKGQRIKDGLSNVAKKTGRKIGDKTGMRLIRGFKDMSSEKRLDAIKKELWSGTKTIAPKALKAGTRYALAGSAAILAGSAALISGDPKSVLSAVGIASKGGRDIGNKLGDKTVSGVTSASNTFLQGYRGKDYDTIKSEQYARQQAYSSETADAMLAAFGKDKQQNAMNAAYEMRVKTGVDDNQSIIKALSTTKEFGGDKVKDEDAVDLDAAKNMPLMDKYMDEGVFTDYKKYETQKNKISKALRNKGIDPNTANRRAEKALRDYAKYKGKHLAIPGQAEATEESGNSTPSQNSNGSRRAGSTSPQNGNGPRRGDTRPLNSGNNVPPPPNNPQNGGNQ